MLDKANSFTSMNNHCLSMEISHNYPKDPGSPFEIVLNLMVLVIK